MTATPRPPRNAVIISLALLERRVPAGEPIEMPGADGGWATATFGGVTFAALVPAAVRS